MGLNPAASAANPRHPDDHLSPAESTICAVWGIGAATYRLLLRSGDLPVPTVLVGGRRMVARAEILRAVSERDATA